MLIMFKRWLHNDNTVKKRHYYRINSCTFPEYTPYLQEYTKLDIEKQNRYFELKLFITMEIFYIVSLLSVVFHNPEFDNGSICICNDDNERGLRELMKILIDKGKSYMNAL